MGNYEIRADVEKNRLYILAEGFLTAEENKESVDKVLEELKKLRPGLGMITDLSKMKVASQEGAQEFERTTEAFKAMDIKRNIIVVEDAIARMQIDRHSRKQEELRTEFASSVEEAERMLDGEK